MANDNKIRVWNLNNYKLSNANLPVFLINESKN